MARLLQGLAAAAILPTSLGEYRSRGYLRHIHWWGEYANIGAGMAEARRRLDAGEGRRVGEARDAWARRDERRPAEHDVAHLDG